jgi:TetR/AcrR family transcriptional regulator
VEYAESLTKRSRQVHSRDREVTLPAILAAAEIEFATNGFAAARTESIAARAHVVKGMIFHYFKSKEGLFEAVLERAFQPFREALDRAIDTNQTAMESLLSLVEGLLSAMSSRPLAPVIFMLESIQGGGEHIRKLGMNSFYTRVEALLKKGMAAGEFRPMDPWQSAINVVGLCGFYYCAANNLSHARKGSIPLGEASLKKHTAEVLALIQAGLTTRK